MVAAVTLRQCDHPSCSSPNPCLNKSINNPLSKVHCQPSLDPAEEVVGSGKPKNSNWCVSSQRKIDRSEVKWAVRIDEQYVDTATQL